MEGESEDGWNRLKRGVSVKEKFGEVAKSYIPVANNQKMIRRGKNWLVFKRSLRHVNIAKVVKIHQDDTSFAECHKQVIRSGCGPADDFLPSLKLHGRRLNDFKRVAFTFVDPDNDDSLLRWRIFSKIYHE